MKKGLLLVLAVVISITTFAQDFSEDFSSVTVDENIALTGWTNVAVAGTRVFIGKYYSGEDNSYAQMSAYNSGEASEIVYFITPGLEVTSSSVLTFDTKLGYAVNDPASAFISTDYSGDIANATWSEITYTHATAPSDGYGDWVASGDVDLSSYDGQTVYIAFAYTGGDPEGTTTMQLDNVLVTNATVVASNIEDLSSKLSVFPNPAVNTLNISSDSNIRNISISNVIGQRVVNFNDINTNNYSLNVADLAKGVYLINIENVEGTSVIKKFVKK